MIDQTQSPRLLIITLSIGEAALPTLRRQLAEQTFQNFEHVVAEGLDNAGAHRFCYQSIMDRAADFDYAIKIDADMTLQRPTALAEVLAAVSGYPDHNQFTFQIDDFFTGRLIGSVILFRSGVQWPTAGEKLFVDPDPMNAVRLDWQGAPAPFVNHGEIVSDVECFSFGVHKAVKVLQRGRAHKAGGKRNLHFRNLAQARDLYRRTGARRHALVLIGALWALENKTYQHMADKNKLAALFDADIAPQYDSWKARAERLAHSNLAWWRAFAPEIGLWRTLKLVRRAG